MTDTTATPEGAPVTVEAGLASVLDTLAAEDNATETAETPEPEAEAEADTLPAQDSDSDEEPEAQDGEEAEVEAEEAEEAEPEPLPVTVKVKVNGEELEVSLDEALKGYSRTEDYKAKTAALANERRALEGQFAETVASLVRHVEMFDPVLAEASQTDWAALAQQDPGEYVARKAAVEERQSWLTAARQEVARHEQAQMAQTIEAERAALHSAIPALADPETERGFFSDLVGYLKASDMKFDDATINSVTDHRFYLLAEKARKWDAAQKAKATLPAKQVAPKPTVKTLKPSAPVAAPVRKPGPRASEAERLAWVLKQI